MSPTSTNSRAAPLRTRTARNKEFCRFAWLVLHRESRCRKAADLETSEDNMYSTSAYVAEQIAREYTRDRIRDAEARRAARAARSAARERQYADATGEPVAPVRRWWIFPARATTA